MQRNGVACSERRYPRRETKIPGYLRDYVSEPGVGGLRRRGEQHVELTSRSIQWTSPRSALDVEKQLSALRERHVEERRAEELLLRNEAELSERTRRLEAAARELQQQRAEFEREKELAMLEARLRNVETASDPGLGREDRYSHCGGALADRLIRPWTSSPREDAHYSSSDEPAFAGMSTNEAVERWVKGRNAPSEPVNGTMHLGARRPAAAAFDHSPARHLYKPPKLDVREFDGDPEAYPFFASQLRDARLCYPDIHILQHLQGRLKGVAFQAVKGLLLTGAALDDVLSILDENFGDPRVVSTAVLDRLLERPRVKASDLNELALFSTEVANALATLQSVGQMEDLNYRGNLDAVARKLPQNALDEWCDSAFNARQAGIPLLFEHFVSFMRRYVAKRRMSEPAPLKRHNNMTPARRPAPDTRKPVHAVSKAELPSTSNMDATQRGTTCYLCGGDHLIRSCKTFSSYTPQERLRWTQRMNACTWCLKPGHAVAECSRKNPCGVRGCEEKHHRLLHGSRPETTNTRAAPVGAVAAAEHYTTMMKTVTVDAFAIDGSSRRCVAYLDEGSAVTFIDSTLARELGLDMDNKTTLKMRTMNGTSEEPCSKVTLSLQNITTRETFRLTDVHTMDSLPIARQPISLAALASQFPEVASLDLPDQNAKPRMLIGLDHADLIATREIRRTSKNGPLMQRTQLGWTVTGRVVMPNNIECSRPVNFLSELQLDDAIKASWRTEDFGCKFNGPARSREDRLAEAMLDQSVKHDGERWVAPLLWRQQHSSPLPPSRAMAERRARGFEKKLDKSREAKEGDVPLRQMVSARMEKMLNDGHFRKLPSAPDSTDQPVNTWYLPLHAVQNPNKPGKVRLVLDAAAKGNGKCLNDFLMSGPDFFNSIPGMILRWREKKVALSSDVVAMFSQIRIRDEDLPAQRFLWRGDRRHGEFDVFESPRLMFGATSSPSTAAYCYRKTAEVFAPDRPDVQRAIVDDTYVDDLLTGADSDEEAVALVDGITDTLRRGGFELAPWASSSAAVRAHTGADNKDTVDLTLGGAQAVTRALGVLWRPCEDDLVFKARPIPEQVSKCVILSMAMSVFDPSGFLCGWLLRPKLLMQQLWRRGVQWDDPLPEDLSQAWDEWVSEMSQLSQLRIPRFLFNEAGSPIAVQLHVFCDASEDGFAAAAYYRWTDTAGRPVVKLACAKSRLAPIKTLTIPRLELQGAVLASRLVAFIREQGRTKIESTTCWSDSKNVLAWIRATDRRFHTFVANRIAEIQDVTEQSDWRYVPTDMNPADAASRGQNIEQLAPDGEWSSGPRFLYNESSSWPTEDRDATSQLLTNDSETKSVYACTPASPSLSLAAILPDAARFSRWPVAVRTVVLVLRFAGLSVEKGAITAEELSKAERLWISSVQQSEYACELQKLRRGLAVSPRSPLSSLSPLLVDGLICIDSRIKRSPDLSVTAKFPPILPRHHPYTRLLIQYLHSKMAHRAHDAVLVELRQRCWVPQARRTILSVAHQCQLCKVRKTRPQSARMAPLPLARVAMMAGPFMTTGLDYFGPMPTARGRSTIKTWGVIFRCLSTKAVHLDLVDSLDTDAALGAISRFQARRGNVKEIWSDNGTNFTSANRELRDQLQQLNQTRITEHLAINGIKWRFNAPGDKEAGGVWERNIRTVKDTLKVILREHRPTFNVLRTLLCEVERILNSTPLFHVPIDHADADALTPYHFLIGRASPAYPPGVFEDGDMCLRRRWKFSQRLADHFWARWIKEYLPTLSLRTRWQHGGKGISVGDVVIVVDDQHPRGVWPKGIVEEVFQGPDGVNRTAVVRTRLGHLRRPVRKLAPIEVSP